MRGIALAFGTVAYASGLAAFAALVAFLTNAGLVRGVDIGAVPPWPLALVVDVALMALFGASHSVMARPAFKERWTRIVPHAIERSAYVLVASASLALLVWQWRPLPAAVWEASSPIARVGLWGLFAAGGVLLAWATFLTDHFDLFGLRQTWLYARGRPYTPVSFAPRSLYKRVRHPMMLGILMLVWVTPTMSVGHLLFAAGMSGYIVIGVTLEERDLSRAHGEPYRAYRRRVGAILPRIR
jgi:protein-S-isoprenylcysteine O-methyltransferase Ste14